MTERCPICDWPMAERREDGCVPGDCSYRPEQGSPEWHRIRQRRAEIEEAVELTAEQLAEYERRATMAERKRCETVAASWRKHWLSRHPGLVGEGKIAADACIDTCESIEREIRVDGRQ